jgi:hypothetical protein
MQDPHRCRGRQIIAAATLLGLCSSYAGAQSANIPTPGAPGACCAVD